MPFAVLAGSGSSPVPSPHWKGWEGMSKSLPFSASGSNCHPLERLCQPGLPRLSLGVGHPSSDPPEPITEVGVTAASSGACTTDTAASGSEALEPWPQPAGAGGLARKGARPLTATLPGSRPAASGCLGPERHLIRGLVLWPPA